MKPPTAPAPTARKDAKENAICESPFDLSQTIVDLDAALDSPVQGIRVYIPFEGSEATCWDCKEQRYLMVDMTLKGKTLSWSDFCGDPFDDTRMSFYTRTASDLAAAKGEGQ